MYTLTYEDCLKAKVRFDAKVDRTGGPDACHPHKTASFTDGYGMMRMKIDGHHKNVRMHRIAYVLATGESIDSTDLIDHYVCGEPRCCNPKHLRKTDAKGNAETRRRGVPKVGPRKFLDHEIMEIRRRWAAGVSLSVLRADYRVCARSLEDIVYGLSYKHLPTLSRPVGFVPRSCAHKLNPCQVAEIKRRLNAGESRSELAKEFKVSLTQIGRIARGVAWKHIEPASDKHLELIAAD